MTNSVEEELRRKLEGTEKALDEVHGNMTFYMSEIAILEQRRNDLKKALSAFSFEVMPAPSYDDADDADFDDLGFWQLNSS